MKRIFQRQDWLTALFATLVTMAVYVYTTAPNVTLLDSGEFIVAAQHFGVPHPTGYPLWTLTSWLFSLLPLGNAAWEIALWSAICGSFAVGVCALLSSNLLAWMGFLPDSTTPRFVRPVVTITFSLLLAFSQSMWSQAVIAEVYALHALMIGLYFLFLYAWVRRPHKDSYMLGAFFILALSFGNHHLTLALSPLPFLLILLLRRRALLDWLMAGILTVLLVYLGFAILSSEVLILSTAIRFFYCVAIGLAVMLWLRRFRIRWHLIAFLPIVVIVGLLPYLYMPIASGTNPPMNWSYAREPQGFFYSINRSQYSGPLTEQSLKTLGRLMGTYPQQLSKPKEGDVSLTEDLKTWTGFFWLQLSKAFTPLCIIFYFGSFFAVLRLPLAQRSWVYLLHIAFVLAAFLQPVMDTAQVDMAGWWLQMPYHTYTNLIFAILLATGAGFLLSVVIKRRRLYSGIAIAMLVMPALTFQANYAESSQRDHWFGWMFGHDMLKDLPKNSIVIGGTDPGRFVPTYMILGESTQPPALKRDPDFDRRDLYIITQNALGEPTYMKYLRDQYTTARPKVKNGFERWLGRENAYPEKPILLPNEQEVEEIAKQVQKESAAEKIGDPQVALFGAVLKWMWEKNRDEHEFFIEESFPIVWTYDYAIPHGLVYKLGKEKMDKLPPEIVAQDFAFWKDYKAKLLDNPHYMEDYDAQRSFSKLRQSIANIYRYKKMDKEAILAYNEALELWPENGEVLAALGAYLWKKEQYDTVVDLFVHATQKDYNNVGLWRLRLLAEQRKEVEGQIKELREKLNRQPKNRETITKLFELYAKIGDTERADLLASQTLKDFPGDADMLRLVVVYYQQNGETAKSIPAAIQLTTAEGTNPQNYILLANAYFGEGKKPEFYEAARKAIEIGGLTVRERLSNEPALEEWRSDPEFQELILPKSGALPSVPASTPAAGE